MFSSRTVRTLLFALAVGILLIAFSAWWEAWQAQKVAQVGQVESLALPTATSTALPTTVPAPPTDTPTIGPNSPPAVNAEGTPLKPTPDLYLVVGTPVDAVTNTPDPNAPPTETPIPVMTDINMAEGLPDSEAWLIIVRRADGKIDRYRIPAEQVRPYFEVDPPAKDALQAFLNSIVHLKPGESIAYAYFANYSGMGVPPNLPVAETEVPLPTAANAAPAEQSNTPQPLYLPQVGR